ncbi:MAG: carbohydrate porin [Verrucomicrobiia bacterium]
MELILTYIISEPWPIILLEELNRTVFEGLTFATLDIDFEKLLDFKGGTLHVSMIYPHGERFSNDYVGDINVVSLIDLRNSIRLWELWYEQKFWEKKIALRFVWSTFQ